MSRKLFAFLLSELGTLRVVCKQCSGVAEMTIDRACAKFETQSNCPLCNQPLFGMSRGADNPLHRLATAIRSMQEHKTVDVEFVTPDNGEPKPKADAK